MQYNIKAHPTLYKGVLFRSRLEARWAAFFDLAGWTWEYEPFDFNGWTPDFRVSFPCGHSECSPFHVLFVEVKPYTDLGQFATHQCLKYPYGRNMDDDGNIKQIPADASAAFGNSPDVTYWEMGHGAGGGVEQIDNWVRGDIKQMWNEAGLLTRYEPRGR